MTFVSYAQNFEDVLLSRALRDVRKGHYLDIGAQDPIVDSVSLAFYERGWRGVHVEPAPAYAAKLREHRPDETVIEAVVTDTPGVSTFFEIPETGISTGKRTIAAHHARKGYVSRKISVPTVRLDQLFDLFDGDIHWLKIDVEGMEREVLRSWGDSGRRPWILVIEATFPTKQDHTEKAWLAEVMKRGYSTVFFDGLSRYFVHEAQEQLASCFDASVNIFDDFVVSPNHFVASRLREQLQAGEDRLKQEQERASQFEQARALAALQEQQLHEALTARDLATAQQSQLFERLIATEADHAATIDRLSRERIAAEAHLHWLAGENQNKLRDELAAAEVRVGEARVELARLDERVKGLESDLSIAESALKSREAEQSRVEDELQESKAALESQKIERRRAEDEFRQSKLALDHALTESQSTQALLTVEIERLFEERSQLEQLVRAALEERPDFWQRLGIRLGLTARSSGWKALAGWRPTPANIPAHHTISSEQTELTMRHPANQEQPGPVSRATSLAELLSLHDADFVRSVYVTILGRSADPEGEAYYLERLRSGRSQMHIISQFRSSREARDHDPGIAGLDRALRRASWERRPIIGAFSRLLTGNYWESPANQVARALMEANAHLLGRLSQLEDQVHGVGSTVRSLTSAQPKDLAIAGANAVPFRPTPRQATRVSPVLALAQRIRSDWLAA